jgi:hypothetical protein
VKPDAQRGATLVEVVVATGIAAIAIGSTLAVVLPAVHHLTPDPRDVALQTLVDRELRVAADVLKYDGSALAPASETLNVPIPNASPFPATVTLETSVQSGATFVRISAADSSGAHAARTSAVFAARAPQPDSTIAPDVLVPAPTGAP